MAANWSRFPELMPRGVLGVMPILLSTAILPRSPLICLTCPTPVLKGSVPPLSPPQDISATVRVTTADTSTIMNLLFFMTLLFRAYP